RDLKPKKKAPSPRRDGREAAVQFLYGHEAQGELDTSAKTFERFWTLRDAKAPVREFAEQIVRGFAAHADEIDETIRRHLENYSFQRLSAVDRNILRVGAYEILHATHIPAQAAINEAIEIAKRFGSEDSAGFVNGVLDRILKR
ncbi:MAG TPA: transcription antitermination factor NusB, partial [Bacteroidia bacterium]|nr:transcription antitermination factor NusB [Bacteroidia bacterium]